MPDPDYLGGSPPGGLLGFIIGTIALVILFIILKSCMWGG